MTRAMVCSWSLKYKVARCRRLILSLFAGMRGSIVRAGSACSLFGRARCILVLGIVPRSCASPGIVPVRLRRRIVLYRFVDLAPLPSVCPAARWWAARSGLVPVAIALPVARPSRFVVSMVVCGGRARLASGYALGRACAFLRSRILSLFPRIRMMIWL